MTLLQRLISIQQALGLSERDFAEKLNINHATWNQTRRGLLPLNDTVLAGALNAFPELEEEIIAFRVAGLRARATELARQR